MGSQLYSPISNSTSCLSAEVSVVSKMGILAQFSSQINQKMTENNQNFNPQNCIKRTNKIPEYTREYKREYLEFIYYIKDTIIRLKKSQEENWGEILIYEYVLNLVNFINKYLNNPTEYLLRIVDWYFIDLIINKDKIIVRGAFYELGLHIEDEVVCEGLLELESMINKIN